MSLLKKESLSLWLDSKTDFSPALDEIRKLQNLLSCHSCEKLMDKPVTLWSCDHMFCQECVETFNNKCKVCSMPCWPEDQRENKAINDISRLTSSLKEILENFMIDIKQMPDKTTSTKMNDEPSKIVPKKNKQNTRKNKDMNKTPNSRPPATKASKKRSKFKITPSKPFPDVPSDSEEFQVVEINNRKAELEKTPVKHAHINGLKPNLNEVTNDEFAFATPSPPPKRKRPSVRTPYTPVNSGRNISSPSGMKTPRTPRAIKKNKRGETSLHIAAMKGKIDEMRSLIEEGADLNAKDNAGWTPLHEACNHGHIDAVQELLRAGVLVNTPGYEDETALMDAVLNGHFEIVELLLQNGADASLRNSRGQTALDLALDDEIVEILKENKYSSQIAISSPKSEAENFPDFAPEDIIISFSNAVRPDKAKTGSKVLGANFNTKDAVSATHYIVPSYEDGKSPRTIKYMQAIARGIWILKCDWLEACTVTGGWVAETSFEIPGSREDILSGGPKKSRLNKAAQCPAIFHGCHFYLSGNFKPPSANKQQLTELLQLAGGIVLTREPKPDSDSIQTCTKVPYHAHKDSAQYFYTYYIVYDNIQGKPSRFVRRGKVCTVPLTWVYDCISQFYLCEIPE